MVSSSSTSSMKLFLMTFITLSVLAMVASGYLGPRYGKRLPSGEVGRIVGRSSGPRTIQSRSQARFYAGSRYGGKRSYWPNVLVPDVETPENTPSNPPFDCIFVPYLGVRCAVRSEETAWSNSNDNDDEGPSMVRTSVIGNPPSAAAAVMGSEA